MMDAYLKAYLPGLAGTVCAASIAFYLVVLRNTLTSIRAIPASAGKMVGLVIDLRDDIPCEYMITFRRSKIP